MRLIDADALKKEIAKRTPHFAQRISFTPCFDAIRNAPTVCCETCKHGIKGERIGGHEYFSCVKPYAGTSNYHTKDWFCGDWKDKNAVD